MKIQTRKNLIVAAVVGLVALHLLAHLSRINFWPITSYSMYSFNSFSKFGHSVTALGLSGITEVAGQGETEVPRLNWNWKFTRPLASGNLQHSFQRMIRTGKKKEIEDSLAFLLQNYMELKRLKRHDGPSLTGIRLYQYEWILKREDWRTPVPEKTVKIAEVKLI